jgi:hypothetical protein
MKITMIPGSCANEYQATGATFCESCFARFLMRRGNNDLACITAVETTDAEHTTLVMQRGGFEQQILLTDDTRERLVYGDWQGWTAFVEEGTAAMPA